nr:3-oxoacyl-[acyl-carrier-protein] reductase fabg [Quercus suber]
MADAAGPKSWVLQELLTDTPEHSIGAACARDLWANGTSLALTYSSNKASIDELFDELHATSNGRKLTIHQADVSHDVDLTRLFDEVQRDHGQGPDILVVNAGFGIRASNILDIDIEDWDYIINVNLRASFVLTKLAVPHMLQQHWGRVVYISSIAAGGTSIMGCHYSASKAGVQGLSKNLANKMGKDGITFNDVAPAMITGTGMIRDEEQLKGTPGDVKNIPVGRAGSTQECANVVTMLCRTGLRLVVPDRHQLADHQVLLSEPLLPAPQRFHLLPAQILQLIERALQVLGQHVLVEAPAGQPATRVSAGEVGIWTARAVEVAAGGDVEDLAAHGQIDGHAVGAVVGEELRGREDAEDGGRGRGRQCHGWFWPQPHVHEDDEDGEQENVDGRCDGRSGAWSVIGGREGLGPSRGRTLPPRAVLRWCSFCVLGWDRCIAISSDDDLGGRRLQRRARIGHLCLSQGSQVAATAFSQWRSDFNIAQTWNHVWSETGDTTVVLPPKRDRPRCAVQHHRYVAPGERMRANLASPTVSSLCSRWATDVTKVWLYTFQTSCAESTTLLPILQLL